MLSRDLSTMGKHATNWQMRFSVIKCKMMHTGGRFMYILMVSDMVVTNQNRDLKTVMDSSME